MPCYHPLIAIPKYKYEGDKHVKLYTENGKIDYKIIATRDYFLPDILENKDMKLIPCGKCIGCRLDYSRTWANRLMLELQYHDSAYFVTLTYNNLSAPVGWYADPETGEAFQSLTLSKRDCQLFMKRLRKARPDDNIRYYCAGEYGTQTYRPHYHWIIFGLHLDDLQPFGKSELGYQYYRSALLEKLWSDPETGESKGFVSVGEVTWETCAYTARYVTKKLTGDAAEVYTNLGMIAPFALMSRRPGIAYQYYQDHPDCVDKPFINISTEKGGLKFRPPKYFERMFERDNPDEAEQRKEARQKLAKASLELKMSQTDMSYGDYLRACEDIKEKRIKALRRKL